MCSRSASHQAAQHWGVRGRRFLTEGTLLSTRSGISDGFEHKDRAEALQDDLASSKFISYIQKWN